MTQDEHSRGDPPGHPRRDAANSLVFCIGEDIGIPGGFGGAFTVTLGLSDEFGHERILDTPISELGSGGVSRLVRPWPASAPSPMCSTPTSCSWRWTNSSTTRRK